MPEKCKPSHAINDSFRPRTTCVHLEKGKKNSQCISCGIVTYSVNVLHHMETQSRFKMHNAKANGMLEGITIKNIESLNRKSLIFLGTTLLSKR